jgi:hypothetical protein
MSKFQISNFKFQIRPLSVVRSSFLVFRSCDSRIAFTADPKTIHEITRTDTKKL